MKQISVYRTFTGWGILFALIINFALFASLAGLIKIKMAKNDLESLNSVSIARMRQPEPLPEPEKKREEPKEKKPEQVTKINHKRAERVMPKNLNLDMPDIDLATTLKTLNSVPVVTAPEPLAPPGPVVDFNKIMNENEVDILPVPGFKKNPRYPYRARRMNIAGEVQIKFLVDKQGNISNIEIIKATPSGIFEESVIEAVSSWKYSPGELLGRKVATVVTTTIVFKLE